MTTPRHPDLSTLAENTVLARLDYLDRTDARYRAVRPEHGSAENFAFDQHRNELADLRAAFREAGLSEADRDLFDRYYGFRREGKDAVSGIGRDHGRTEAEVHERIREISVALAETDWARSWTAPRTA